MIGIMKKGTTVIKKKELSIEDDACISVIIPTLNAGEHFPLLLQTLRDQNGLKKLEIVIVDSGSTDDTVSIAKEYNAKVVEISPESFTHSYSRNIGAESATGEYLFFTVQDALPASDVFLQQLLKVLKNNDVAAVSCAEHPREDVDLFYRIISWNHYEFLGVNGRDKIFSMPAEENHITLRQNGQLSDIACFIPKHLFLKYKYQYNYAEDLDLGIRIIKDGHRIAFLSSVKIIHSHNRPPYYYVKRGYADQLILTKIFPDYPSNAITSERLAGEILTAYKYLNHLTIEHLFHIKLPCKTEDFINDITKIFMMKVKIDSLDNVTHHNKYIDENLDSFLIRLGQYQCSSLCLNDHRPILFDGLFDFVTTTSFAYLKNATDYIDDNLLEEFHSHLYKVLALFCGINIANSYLSSPDTFDNISGKIRYELLGGV